RDCRSRSSAPYAIDARDSADQGATTVAPFYATDDDHAARLARAAVVGSRVQEGAMGSPTTGGWPRLRVADWTDTRDTLHLWTQIVGKIRMAHSPAINHWWHVTLYVSPRGLTTSAIPYRDGVFDLEFDFLDHQLRLQTSDGRRRQIALAPRSVADFYHETMQMLDDVD